MSAVKIFLISCIIGIGSSGCGNEVSQGVYNIPVTLDTCSTETQSLAFVTLERFLDKQIDSIRIALEEEKNTIGVNTYKVDNKVVICIKENNFDYNDTIPPFKATSMLSNIVYRHNPNSFGSTGMVVIHPINQSNSIQMPVFFKEGSDAQTVKINLNQFPYINENIDILINLLANCQGCELNISVIPTEGESMKTFILTYPSNLKSEAVAEIKEVLTMLNSNKDIKDMISRISFSIETNPHISTTVGRSIDLGL